MTNPIRIVIPEGITIDSLNLSRDSATGAIAFDWSPIERICEASSLDISLLRDQDEGNVAALLAAWYEQHLQHGGNHNIVLDQLIAEARIEEAIDTEGLPG